jgi:HD superfamily phosphohydrolase
MLKTLIEQDFIFDDIYLMTKLKKQQADIKELKNRLANANNFKEDKGYDNWQDWFEARKWLLGSENIILMQRTINENFKTDFLTKHLDGFLDLIELKNPALINGKLFDIIIKQRDGKQYNVYQPAKELNNAIFQCIRYIRELEKKSSNIDSVKKFENTFIIKPRATLVFGRSNSFTPEEWEALRLLNSHLNHINVITYDILLNRAERIIEGTNTL